MARAFVLSSALDSLRKRSQKQFIVGMATSKDSTFKIRCSILNTCFLGVCVVRDVNELSNLGWIDFLIFTAQRNNIVLREYKKIRSKLKRKANKESSKLL